ncbi:MAG TPA: MarR family winged helix-turn-helix transcriptional regulator [Trebonia sp.]|nr:MarR family winged helix-turn-helix transcriptional regulator [Trebonia sp.]
MTPHDSVDRHIEHWIKEIPGLNPVAEGVITRMQMLLRHLDQTRQATLAAHGLELHEYGTLHMLGGCGPDHQATPGEIAAWLRMSPSGITGRLDGLERRGFIRRLPSAGDRRKVTVELTDEGRRAWLEAFNEQGAQEARLLAALDPGQQEELSGLLRRMLLVIDRPGLLDPPASEEPRKEPKGPRFTELPVSLSGCALATPGMSDGAGSS